MAVNVSAPTQWLSIKLYAQLTPNLIHFAIKP